MDYENITNKTKEVLRIADVSESFLTFENDNATFEIYKGDKTGFEIRGDEGFYITNEQRDFMIKWLA